MVFGVALVLLFVGVLVWLGAGAVARLLEGSRNDRGLSVSELRAKQVSLGGLVTAICGLGIATIGVYTDDSPRIAASTTVAGASRTATTALGRSETTTAAVDEKGPDPASFLTCQEYGPAEMAKEFGVSAAASRHEIAAAFVNEMLIESFRSDGIESCLMGFEAGGW